MSWIEEENSALCSGCNSMVDSYVVVEFSMVCRVLCDDCERKVLGIIDGDML